MSQKKMQMPYEQPYLSLELEVLEIMTTAVLTPRVQAHSKEIKIQILLSAKNIYYKKLQKQKSRLALQNI
jgi:hypothetical protein